MPRIRAPPAPASDEVDDTSSDGLTWVSWRMSLMPEFSSVSAVTALTASGTSLSASLRRVAVTMMSPLSTGAVDCAVSATAAASAVAPSVGVAAPLSVSVLGAVCAIAVVEMANKPADSSQMDLRMRKSPFRKIWGKT